jgi:hypothetical protein
VLHTSRNDHNVARAADPLFAAEAELHLALEHTRCARAGSAIPAMCNRLVVLGDVERWLNLDTTLDDVDPLGPERFAVRAANKVSEKNIDGIECVA